MQTTVDRYVIHERPGSALVALAVGAGTLWAGMYLPVDSSFGAFALAGLGIVLIVGGVYTLFTSPRPLLTADRSGITVYSIHGKIDIDYNRPKKVQVVQRSATQFVPWEQVSAVAVGTRYRIIARTSKVVHSPALLIAVDPSISLEGFGDRTEAVAGRSPGSETEVNAWPGSLIPGHETDSLFCVDATFLDHPTETAVKHLLAMKKHHTR